MGVSGLREVLEVIYASNTVGHMPSGKAESRAMQGHLLIYTALNAMLAGKVLCLNSDNDLHEQLSTPEETQSDTVDVQSLIPGYNKVDIIHWRFPEVG